MLSEPSGRLPLAWSFFGRVARFLLPAIVPRILAQVRALARHARLHITHLHGRCYTRALTVQRKRTHTVPLCALFARSRGSGCPAIVVHEQMREDPSSFDLGAAESDEIGGKAWQGSPRLCDSMQLKRRLAANAADQAAAG